MKSYKEFITEAGSPGWRRRSKRSKTGIFGPQKQPDENANKPKAYVTIGVPGTGKTSKVRHMKKRNPNVSQHELDRSRQEMGKSPKYFGSDLMAHHKSGIESAAKQGKTIVVSNTSIPSAHRSSALSDLKNLGYDAKPVVLPTSPRAARRRNRNRPAGENQTPGSGQVPGTVMRAMSRQFRGINTNPRGGGALSRKDKREGRKNFKELHKKYRFTKPAMRASGAIREGMIPWRSTVRPGDSGWMPSEKTKAKAEQLKKALKKNSSLQGRYDNLMRVIENPPVKTGRSPHISNFEKLSGISLGRSRRNTNQRVLPKSDALPGNAKRRKIYQSMMSSSKS